MDREKVKGLRDALQAALAPFAAANGVAVEVGSASFTGGEVRFQVDVTEIAADGTARTREAEAYEKLATLYGLPAGSLGREFQSNGKAFTITGLNARAGRFPVMAKDKASGRTYRFPVATIVARLPAAGEKGGE
jgi:hypothetical protein